LIRNYYKVLISFVDKDTDLVFKTLYINGVNNILEDNNKLTVFFPEGKEKLLIKLLSSFRNLKSTEPVFISVNTYKGRDWYKLWEKSVDIINIKNKIVIYPPWKKNKIRKYKNKLLIEIEPKMSFGTGYSETTQVMLGLMCDYISPEDKYMLDYGCGTALLSIAGIKLGLHKAVAIDIDKDSVFNAKEYLKKNKVLKQVKLYNTDLKKIRERNFDIICANIDFKVIVNNIMLIYKKLKQEGKLFISGILKKEEKSILEILSTNDFLVKDLIYKSKWLGIYSEKTT